MKTMTDDQRFHLKEAAKFIELALSHLNIAEFAGYWDLKKPVNRLAHDLLTHAGEFIRKCSQEKDEE